MFEFDGSVIPGQSEVKQEAWEFMKWCSTKEMAFTSPSWVRCPAAARTCRRTSLMSYERAVFAEIMKTIAPLVLPNSFRYEGSVPDRAERSCGSVWLGEKRVEVIGSVKESFELFSIQPRA